MTEQAGKSWRLFTALPVPADIARRLTDLPRRGLAGARWLEAGDLHITLRFLGDLENPDLPALVAALGRVRRPAFHVEGRGLDIFENARQAVVHARIESVRRVTTLCADVTDALTPLGFDFGVRPFVPHITLARADNARAARDWCRARGGGVPFHWKAERFCLMRSRGAGEGDSAARYETLESFALAG